VTAKIVLGWLDVPARPIWDGLVDFLRRDRHPLLSLEGTTFSPSVSPEMTAGGRVHGGRPIEGKVALD
jgi:hypothetical protein